MSLSFIITVDNFWIW